MIKIVRKAYSLQIDSRTGIVQRLSVPTDPAGINLAHVGNGFGAMVFTRRDEESVYMQPNNRPGILPGGDVVNFREHCAYASLASLAPDRAVFSNPVTKHKIRYVFAEEYFDLWLEGELPLANQVGLELDLAFMDLRQADPPEYQYTVKCPYRSADRSLCYVFLERVVPPGLLVSALTPAAAWRLLYHGRIPNHYIEFGSFWAVQGLQMLCRFDNNIDQDEKLGPVQFGIRISFPEDIWQARLSIVRQAGIPIITAPFTGGSIGDLIPFQVDGPAVGAELKTPSGNIGPVPLTRANDNASIGSIRLAEEGFYMLRAWNKEGRGGDCVLHGGPQALPALQRSVKTLDPLLDQCQAENQYGFQALCLARQWFGPDQRHDAILYDAIVRIGMQGVANPGPPFPPKAPTYVARNARRSGRWYLFAPAPEPHTYMGKAFSPFHLNQYERIQDAFEWIRTHLYAADAFENDAFYEQSVRIGQALLKDNIADNGCVYRLGENPFDIHDYTTVIAPLQSLAELYLQMNKRNDPRAGQFKEAGLKIADYLVKRNLDFPTEGISPQQRWTEDGSMACTALSLLFAYLYLQNKSEYLAAARQVLEYHEPWRMDVPDVRMQDSSYRYWETQWENDGEGRAINAGHAWTLWQAEAFYYYALITGDPNYLLHSYNGYRTNFCKFMPDGTSYACFTPDYLPDRLRKKAPMHSYPSTRDRAISYYLWPRSVRTWFRTAAIIEPRSLGIIERMGPVVLNGRLSENSGWHEFTSNAPFFDRLFLFCPRIRPLRVFTTSPVDVLFKTGDLKIKTGIVNKSAAGELISSASITPEHAMIEIEISCKGGDVS